MKPQFGNYTFKNKAFKRWNNKEFLRKIGFLPQNPKLFFLHDSVEKEIESTLEQWGIVDRKESERLLDRLGISELTSFHPYDLSGGELQKAALACLLLRKPELLLLDEPTKGLDPVSKKVLAEILLDLNKEGVTILISTHDIEFAAQYARKCGMMFQGKITTEGKPEQFFQGNFFYTTMVQRLFRHLQVENVTTVMEAYDLCVQRDC